ncbi:MAG: type II toxin-antitoxin system HicB family antitoxin [Candidatus Sungiibacteriota bacterium]
MKFATRQKDNNLNIPVVFLPEPEGGFTVTVPLLPGCVTFGKNLNEAKRMAQEVIELYLEDMAADGESLPVNTDAFLSTIAVTPPRSALIHA